MDKIISLRIPKQHWEMIDDLLKNQKQKLYPYEVSMSDVIRIAIWEKWEREIGKKS